MSAIPAFARIRVGEPIRHEGLSVFPLYPADNLAGDVDYLLSDEAVAAGTVTVEEISEAGSVPTLMVTNTSKHRVLFLEGEELRGTKQNRVLNTTVLIGAGARTMIPVSCVEAGRWHHLSKHFAPSEHSSSSKLRRSLKSSVTRSLREGQGHQSDQGAVWGRGRAGRRVAQDELRKRAPCPTPTTPIAAGSRSSGPSWATSRAPRPGRGRWAGCCRPRSLRQALHLPQGLGPSALRLRDGRPRGEQPGSPAEPAQVDALLERLESAPWQKSPAVGEGEEFRAEAGNETHASVLTFSAHLLHGSAMMAAGV